jgi:putative toxin-antitoxin system antitoxin component (TIGR02293 family)
MEGLMATRTDKSRKPKAPADGKPGAKSTAGSALAGKPTALNAPRGVSRIADARSEYAVKPSKKRTGNGAVVPLPAPAPAHDAIREPATLFDRMGRLLDQPLRSESDVVRMVDAGLPAAAFTQLTTALNIDHGLIAPESTIRRRVQDNMRFTTDESERMVRIARIHALAVDLFGDETAAQAWLTAPAAYVPGAAAVTPYKLSVTDAGARLVEEMLLRTAHGVF